MAILAALLTLGSRFAGKILTTALGWASMLLFGRVPADRQILVLGITFGSVIWMVLVAGVILPDIGAFLLVLLPPQEFVPDWVIRLVMLISALIVPGIVGAATHVLSHGEDRSPQAIARSVLRGYPVTILLAVLLVFLAGLALWRKGTSLVKRWTDAHVPMVVRESAYDQVADDLDRALTAAGIEVTPRAASAAMSKPAQWLAKVAGPGSASLVPERLIQLDGKDIDILIYPMDVLISGKPELVNRARSAMASRLTTSAAYLTTSAEAQAVEDRLASLAHPPSDDPGRKPRFDEAAAAEFAAIDETLSDMPIEYEEWEVLYRQRLQVERDLRAGAAAGENVLGGGATSGSAGLDGALSTIGRLVRAGAAAVVEAAADEKTAKRIDKAAGPGWRWAARVADLAAVAAREAVRTDDDDERERVIEQVSKGDPLPRHPVDAGATTTATIEPARAPVAAGSSREAGPRD